MLTPTIQLHFLPATELQWLRQMQIQVAHKGVAEKLQSKPITSGAVQQFPQNCWEERANNWDLLSDRMPRCKGSLRGGLAMFFPSRWDKNGVYSPAEQITELKQSAGGACQPQKRSLKLCIHASLSASICDCFGWSPATYTFLIPFSVTQFFHFPIPFILNLLCLCVSGLPL